MKYVLSSFGINNPYIVTDLPDHSVYPVAVEGPGFLDLDYSLLMAGTRFLFDQGALRYLQAKQERLSFLTPLLESVARLKEEGLLEWFDEGAIVARDRDHICAKTERMCEDIPGWLGIIRSQWRAMAADREGFMRRFGTTASRHLNEHHFAIVNAVVRIDGGINATLLHDISALVESERCAFSSSELDYIKEVLRPIVCHTIIHDLVRYATEASVLDWDYSQPYYAHLYAARSDFDTDGRLAEQAKTLFTLALPELRPKNIDAVIRFIRCDENVRGLREDVADLLRRGEKINDALGRILIEQVLRAELVTKRRLRRFRFLGSLVSMLVPGGSLLTEAAVQAGTMTIDGAVEKHLKPAHRWLYALVEGDSSTNASRINEGHGEW